MAQQRATDTTETAKRSRRVDWEAVERDYRTGKFTLRELEAKHGVSYAQISRHATKHQWKKDLRDVIRKATDAALLQDAVTTAQKDVTETVAAAVELNRQVILGHRNDLKAARDVALDLLDELKQSALLVEHQDVLADILAGSGAEAKDEFKARQAVERAIDLGNRVSSVKALAEAITKLQVAERKAFGLDEEAPPPEKPADTAVTVQLDFEKVRQKLGGLA